MGDFCFPSHTPTLPHARTPSVGGAVEDGPFVIDELEAQLAGRGGGDEEAGACDGEACQRMRVRKAHHGAGAGDELVEPAAPEVLQVVVVAGAAVVVGGSEVPAARTRAFDEILDEVSGIEVVPTQRFSRSPMRYYASDNPGKFFIAIPETPKPLATDRDYHRFQHGNAITVTPVALDMTDRDVVGRLNGTLKLNPTGV